MGISSVVTDYKTRRNHNRLELENFVGFGQLIDPLPFA